jgi:hypothetical protein
MAVAVVAGAAGSLLLLGGGGWWRQGLWLVLLGFTLGPLAGVAAADRVAAWRGSDTSMGAGMLVGVGVMVVLWLSLPDAIVTILGHGALALLGAVMGGFVVLMTESERRKYERQQKRTREERLP